MDCTLAFARHDAAGGIFAYPHSILLPHRRGADQKTPLLRSMEAVTQALRLLRLFEIQHQK